MQKEQIFEVDEAVVQQARYKWNKHLSRAGNKITISFDEMLSQFTECVSYAEIAQKFNVSRERIRQIYNQYFSDFFKGNLARNKQRKTKIEKGEEELFERKPFSSIQKSAESAGCEFTPVWSLDGKSILLKQIMINGHLCLVKTMTNSFRPNCCKRYYVHTSIRTSKNKKVEFIIFHYEIENFPERIFVVPSAIFEDMILKSKNKRRLDLYIPAEKHPPYFKIPPLIDWWKYENAWQLIV